MFVSGCWLFDNVENQIEKKLAGGLQNGGKLYKHENKN